MPHAPLFIGVDAGSSVMKAAAFDRDMRLVFAASEPTPLARRPGGRVEAEPDVALAAFTRVLSRVTAAVADRGGIVGLGVSGAMVGAWVVDASGRALRPGINWEDARAQPMLDAMVRDAPGLYSEIFAVSGSVLQQGCTLPVVAALMRDEPEILRRAAAVVGYKDWLRGVLTGRIATDVSEAAVAPGDARAQARSPDLMALFGLEGVARLFPDPLPSAAIAGHVTADAARATGLPAGLPVVTGAGDVIANVIGAGGMTPGAVTALLGTTCMVGICRDRPVFEPADLGLLFSLPERRWFRAMVNVAGTLNLDWALDLLCPDLAGLPERFRRAEAMAARVPVGAEGVTYLPYLSESGIIAPVADPAARAGFSGLTARHGRAEMLRAVYEGVALSVADLTDLLDPPPGAPILLTGGGARSALWRGAIAEVTGRSVIVPEGEEFGARGAAMLAATGTGAFASVGAASDAGRAARTERTDPDGAEALAWAAARARYRAARDRALR